MAGSIPPLVSSSPPPLCDYDDDEDDDDEFGMYTAAQDIDYNDCISYEKNENVKENLFLPHGEQDSTSQDSATDSGLCPDSEGMSPTPHSDDERTVKQISCDRLFQQTLELPVLSSTITNNCDSEYSDCAKSANGAESTIVTGLTNGFRETSDHLTEEIDNDFGDFENFTSGCTSSPPDKVLLDNQGTACQNVSVSEGLHDMKEGTKSLQANDFDNNEQNNKFSKELNLTEQIDKNIELENLYSENSTLHVKEPFLNEFVTDHDIKEASYTPEETLNNYENFDAEFEENKKIDNNEFDNFASFKNNISSALDNTEKNVTLNKQSESICEPEQPDEPPKCLPVSQEESDDEFSNFADFSSSDCAFQSAQSSNSLENVSHIPLKPCDDSSIRTDSDFQDWISVFPSGDTCEELTPGEILGKGDVVWSRLFPSETSPALSYQWTNSLTNGHLLSALNIDSRNILFMPWNNSTVPRFAATLAKGPLEPVKAIEPMSLQPTQAPLAPTRIMPSCTQESVPDAHFDWNSSGLTNPLDYPKPVLNMKKPLSTEAQNILSLLPNLSFMRKTYINFPIKEA